MFKRILVPLDGSARAEYALPIAARIAHTLAHESPIPTLILRENEPASLLAGPEAARPLCALVPLDGSGLAETALAPTASLVTALAAPGQGTLHLVQVVKLFSESAEEGFVRELNEEARERASTYLAQVTERLQTTDQHLGLSVTSSVALEKDVASALVKIAEHGIGGKETGDAGCDLIAISTHGRHGLERWVMGSVTDRLLNATKLPMLIVRPQQQG